MMKAEELKEICDFDNRLGLDVFNKNYPTDSEVRRVCRKYIPKLLGEINHQKYELGRLISENEDLANENERLQKHSNKMADLYKIFKDKYEWALTEKTRLKKEADSLQNKINSHAPEGRNYTNGQYVGLMLENERLRQENIELKNELEHAVAFESGVVMKPNFNNKGKFRR